MASDFGAKHLILAAVALVVGLALGGLAPRSENRALRGQVDELQDRKCDSGSRVGREIANVFQGRPWAEDLPEPEAPVPADEDEDDNVVVEQDEDGLTIEIGGDGDEDIPENLEESLEMVQDAMEIRRAQARQALVEADVDDGQLEQIDTIVDDMNGDLAALADDFVTSFQESEGEPDRRDTMLFARDTLDVLLEAEDALYGSLDSDQQEALDEAALDPFSYIDGTVVETFMELDQ